MSDSTMDEYRTRVEALSKVCQAVEANDTFDAFLSALEDQGLSEGRIRQLVDTPVQADFHLHSNCSDGKIPARKLVWLARAMGLRLISLTDHDSISGCREAYREGALLDVGVTPGVELSTGRGGCEVLVYFPLPGKFFEFLSNPKSDSFNRYLDGKQKAIHKATLYVLQRVNVWLKRHGIGEEDMIAVEEVDEWFGGVEPYFPGTLCVLGLKRLDAEARKELSIADPRKFNSKVVTPMLRRLGVLGSGGDIGIKDVFRQVRAMRRAGAAPVTILSHPKELVTKGKLSLGAVAKLVESMVKEHALDGIEVACARDSKEDVRYWVEMVEGINRKIEAGELGRKRGPLLMSSYSSDFHVLAPGRATGEITLGFGMLDERRGHRRGNLLPIDSPEEFLEAMKRRAAGSIA